MSSGGISAGNLAHLDAFGPALKGSAAEAALRASQESTHRKCHIAVMAALSLIAAAGAAALIIYSGGPAQFEFFASGATLGAMAGGLIIWTAIDSVRSCRRQQEAKIAHKQVAEKPVSSEEVLGAITPASPENKAKTHAILTDDQRKELVDTALKAYFAAGHTPTGDEQVTLLSFLTPQYTLSSEQLGQILPICLTKIESESDAEIKTRIAQMSPEQRAALHEHIMATYFPQTPIELSEAQKKVLDALDPTTFTSIFTGMINSMTPERFTCMPLVYQTTFLQQLDTDKHYETAKQIIHKLLTPEFADLFGETLSPEQVNLLSQIGRWPTLAAMAIYASPACVKNIFINHLYNKLDKTPQAAFVKYVVDNLARQEKEDVVTNFSFIIETTASQTPPKLAQATVEIMARVPTQMASVCIERGGSSKYLGIIDQIIQAMSPEAKSTFMNECVALLARTGDYSARVQALIKDSAVPLSLDIAANFLKVYFKHFKEIVLESNNLGSETQRSTFALTLLERMNEDAKVVIQYMNKGIKGYPYYNYLTNMLMEEAKGAGNPSSLSDSRQKLIAHFANTTVDEGYLINVTRNTIVFWIGDQWKLKPEGPAWDNFRAIAAKYPPSA